MFSFIPLGAVCSFYPQVTRCKSFCTTVAINDTHELNVVILLGNISLLSVSFFLFLFLSTSLCPPSTATTTITTTVCVCCLGVLCVLTLQRKTSLLSPILPQDKMILIRDQDTVQIQKLHFLTPPGTVNHFLLLEKIQIKQPKNSHQHGPALQHLFHLTGWPFQMLSMSR